MIRCVAICTIQTPAFFELEEGVEFCHLDFVPCRAALVHFQLDWYNAKSSKANPITKGKSARIEHAGDVVSPTITTDPNASQLMYSSDGFAN